MKTHNFSAGPGILPQEVLSRSAEAVQSFTSDGLSLIEISHRSKDFEAVMDKAVQLVKTLFNLEDRYAVLFLQGGASTQFYMTALNLLGNKAAYVNTGTWASLAIEEARLVGKVDVVADSSDKKFSYIPKGFSAGTEYDYLHYTSNNTIYGSQFHHIPQVEAPLVCDMSSDIFSREIDANRFSLIYAGAQKNMGPAGTTLVVVDKNILGKVNRAIPTMLDYKTHADKGSMFNTPPVFPIYVSMLTLEWLQQNGGLPWIERINREKADLFYNTLDALPCFQGTVNTEDRSRMNATFLLNNESLSSIFEDLLNAAGISGLKGHRSVGGYRASMYNALPLESVQVLTDVMKHFATKHG
jgi:phosphoserine aminotransferase